MQKFVQIFEQFIKKKVCTSFLLITRTILYSMIDEECGQDCGVLQTVFLKVNLQELEQEQEHQQFRLEGQFLSSQFP